MDVNYAKLEAEKKAHIEAKKCAKEAKKEAAHTLATKAKEEEEARMAAEEEEGKMRKKKNVEAKKIQQKKQPEPEPEDDGMPDLDEMMAVLAMSKEDRMKKLDDLFGME